MTLSHIRNRTKKHLLALAVSALAGAVLAMGASFLLRLEYRTSASFIVIQDQRFADPFTQAKSAEYLAGILTKIVETDSFRKVVFEQSPSVAQYFSQDESGLRKSWQRSMDVKAVSDTGIVTISAYHELPSAADALVFAIGRALTSDATTYLGDTAQVKLVQIDGPITSRFPVRPNLVLNVLAGAVVGLMVSGTYVVMRKEKSVEVVRPIMTVRLRSDRPKAELDRTGLPPSYASFEQWLKTGRLAV